MALLCQPAVKMNNCSLFFRPAEPAVPDSEQKKLQLMLELFEVLPPFYVMISKNQNATHIIKMPIVLIKNIQNIILPPLPLTVRKVYKDVP